MKRKHTIAHMQAAYVYAKLSYCKRRQVGCVIVKNNSVIAIGYNGTSPGETNKCEDEHGLSKPNVIHAEDNALRKLIRSPNDATDSVVFVTTCPCEGCARRLADAGVAMVYYHTIYKNKDGIDYLEKRGINVIQVDMPEQQ